MGKYGICTRQTGTDYYVKGMGIHNTDRVKEGGFPKKQRVKARLDNAAQMYLLVA